MPTSAPGIRKTKLQDQTFIDGGRVSIPTKGILPPGRRLRGYELFLDAVITQPAAGAAAQLGAVLHQLVAKITIGRRVSVNGLGLHFLNWMMDGRETDFPAGFPAGVSTVFSRKIGWYVPYSDYSADSPHDGAVPNELVDSDEIGVLFGRAASIFAATTPVVTGTLRTYAVHDAPGDLITIPASHIVADQDFSQLSAVLTRSGRWLYLLAYREALNDPGGITDTQASQITVRVDGEPVILQARPQDLASQYNRTKATSPNVRLESQTVPISGEAINAQPGFAAAAGLGVTTDFLPLLFPANRYKVTDVPEGSQLQVDFTGTLGAYRLVYVVREARSNASASSAARKLGAKEGQSVSVAAQLRNKGLSRYLPLNVG